MSAFEEDDAGGDLGSDSEAEVPGIMSGLNN